MQAASMDRRTVEARVIWSETGDRVVFVLKLRAGTVR